MTSNEAYLELLEEIQNDLEEATEEDNWEGIGDVIHKIREALDNPFDNYNTEAW
jgi:ATP-dependent exoDNAse (exonuclease V) beta subunit